MPTVGIQNTTVWYSKYHSLVQGLPQFGTACTKGWYSVGICISFVISSVSRQFQQGVPAFLL